MTAVAYRRGSGDDMAPVLVFRQFRPGGVSAAPVHQTGGSAHTTAGHSAGQAGGTGFGRLGLPTGWPEAVLPPGAPDWEQSASAWLFDCCPSGYRAYPVLHRHPTVLARFAADFVEGRIRSNRRALARARSSSDDQPGPQTLDAATAMLEADERRLVRLRRAIALVEEALRGKVFIRRP
ncbi:hypothetical protein GCM10009785_27890 [Brooklawnia cerclae]|uniref:Uncharacterized protein n=1 Tax=Brooklawnia cerclae TaxID=349934 RepID=A0ABX0SFZ4_9ACTN|nr:hypothetical protein [Brooklawnia cerclae]NIH56920.1 hypothetical protein [Brooklawnia cerclae]